MNQSNDKCQSRGATQEKGAWARGEWWTWWTTSLHSVRPTWLLLLPDDVSSRTCFREASPVSCLGRPRMRRVLWRLVAGPEKPERSLGKGAGLVLRVPERRGRGGRRWLQQLRTVSGDTDGWGRVSVVVRWLCWVPSQGMWTETVPEPPAEVCEWCGPGASNSHTHGFVLLFAYRNVDRAVP